MSLVKVWRYLANEWIIWVDEVVVYVVLAIYACIST